MKYLIDKAAFDALDPALQALYTQKGDDYVLAVEGLPEPEDTTGLKANRDQILADLKAAKARAKELEDAARDSQTEAARKSGDIEALQNSWQQKYDQAVSQGQSSVQSLADRRRSSKRHRRRAGRTRLCVRPAPTHRTAPLDGDA